MRLHLTNVTGTGAVQLLASLLPALEHNQSRRIDTMYLPDSGPLKNYRPISSRVRILTYRRVLPNALSRALECTILARLFSDTTPLVVFGDIPLNCDATQVVLVQNSLLAPGSAGSGSYLFRMRLLLQRWIFRSNLRKASAFIVQSQFMRHYLVGAYPEIEDRTHVQRFPVPRWLLDAGLARRRREVPRTHGLRLFYPAATYPHKNHVLLRGLNVADRSAWPVEQIVLTIAPGDTPARRATWIRCIGSASRDEMLRQYALADALLFLSTEESYGFPLLEAMHVGIPVVCPNLPYAKAMCGAGAIYFDPGSLESLREALITLKRQLDDGWWPNWSNQLSEIPKSWEEVAESFVRIVNSCRKSA